MDFSLVDRTKRRCKRTVFSFYNTINRQIADGSLQHAKKTDFRCTLPVQDNACNPMTAAVKCPQERVLLVAANRRDFLSVKVKVVRQKDISLRCLRLPAVDTLNPVQ